MCVNFPKKGQSHLKRLEEKLEQFSHDIFLRIFLLPHTDTQEVFSDVIFWMHVFNFRK